MGNDAVDSTDISVHQILDLLLGAEVLVLTGKEGCQLFHTGNVLLFKLFLFYGRNLYLAQWDHI